MTGLLLRTQACRLAFAVVALIGGASVASAQGPRLDPPPCVGGGCELELRYGMLGTRIARVRDSVAPLVGLTGASVVRAVTGVREAQLEAMHGRTQRVRSYTAFGVSAALLAGAYFGLDSESQGVSLASLAALPTSLGVAWFGSRQHKTSMETFERAVWLYNRGLRPETPRR